LLSSSSTVLCSIRTTYFPTSSSTHSSDSKARLPHMVGQNNKLNKTSVRPQHDVCQASQNDFNDVVLFTRTIFRIRLLEYLRVSASSPARFASTGVGTEADILLQDPTRIPFLFADERMPTFTRFAEFRAPNLAGDLPITKLHGTIRTRQAGSSSSYQAALRSANHLHAGRCSCPLKQLAQAHFSRRPQ